MDPFVGEIRFTGFYFAPKGWMTCQGQILPVSQQTVLFSLLGTTFGGNGQTTFQLPDARGRMFVGQGSGPGLPPISMGQIGGTPTTTLTIANMPAHNHQATFTPTGGGAVTGSLQAMANIGAASETAAPQEGSFLGSVLETDTNPVFYAPAGSTGTPVNLGGLNISGGGGGGTVTVGVNGSNQPVSIMNPYLGMNAIIALRRYLSGAQLIKSELARRP